MNPVRTYKEDLVTLDSYAWIEKLQLVAILAFVSTMTLNTRLNSFLLFLSLFLLAFTFKPANLKLHRTPLLIFTSGFVLALISLLYTSNLHEGKLVIERQLGLLFVPLVYLTCFRTDRLKFHIILKFFFVSAVAVSGYLLKISSDKFMASPVAVKDWFVKDNLYHSFSRPIDMHATYLSLYVALAIFTGVYWFLLNNRWWIKLMVFLATLVLVVTLTMLSSRVVISAALCILFFVYPFYIGKLRHKFLLLFAGLIILLASFIVIHESSFITNRFIDKMDDEIKMTSFLKADSTYNPVYGGETRADRWYCAVELIKEKPLKGYGTGSEKDALMGKYEKYNLQNAIVNGYDSHNQYLAYTIKGGFFTLLLFLLSIGYAVYLSVKNKSFIYLSFILLFAVTCITENVLESNKGIFFFAFFNALFCCYCLWQSGNREPVQQQEL